MTEIRCIKCNHCLSKDIELGAGMFYFNPSKVFKIFKEVRKCPSCGAFNEISIELGTTVKVKLIDELNRVDVIILKNQDLYSG